MAATANKRAAKSDDPIVSLKEKTHGHQEKTATLHIPSHNCRCMQTLFHLRVENASGRPGKACNHYIQLASSPGTSSADERFLFRLLSRIMKLNSRDACSDEGLSLG